jgi:hypothetical protein
MTEMVSDLLQSKSSIQKLARTCVPQAMCARRFNWTFCLVNRILTMAVMLEPDSGRKGAWIVKNKARCRLRGRVRRR